MAEKWRIVSQTLQTELSDTGVGFIPVWQVKFEVTQGPAKGTRGQVNIPQSQFNSDAVQEAVDSQVYHLDRVAGL